MATWINRNKESIIRLAFLIPILSVAIISISHVVSWYNLANPISWAIYLSIAVEVAALSSIAASSVKVKGFSVWFVFIIVTLIQFIGNIYFSYTEIDVSSKEFKDWADLTLPVVEAFSDVEDLVAQRRLLAVLEGGLLPLISLTCLHFFIKYGDRDSATTEPNDFPTKEEDSPKTHLQKESERVWERVNKLKEEGVFPDQTEEEKLDEPSALANSQYRNEYEMEEVQESPQIEENVKIISPTDKTQLKERTFTEIQPGIRLDKRPFDTGKGLEKI